MNNYRKAGLILMGAIVVVLLYFNRSNIELCALQPVSMQSVGASGGQLQAVISLKNPNLLSSTIKSIHEKYYLNGFLLGILDNELSQGIPGLKQTDFPINVRFSKADYYKALALDSAHAVNPEITVEGEIAFQNLFNAGNIKVHQTAPLTISANEK